MSTIVEETPKKRGTRSQTESEAVDSTVEDPDHRDESSDEDSVVTQDESGTISSTATAGVSKYERLSYKGPRAFWKKFLAQFSTDLAYDRMLSLLDTVEGILKAEVDLSCKTAGPNETQEELDKWIATAKSRRNKLAMAISSQPLNTVRAFKESLNNKIDWDNIGTPNALEYAKLCVVFVGSLVDNGDSFNSAKSEESIEKEQKKADRIKKNKTAFYPKKLSHASEIGPFLEALKLECMRIPMWKRCVSFAHYIPHKTKEHLYDYLTFHSDASCVKSMLKHDFHNHKESEEEGYFSLYLSTIASLSDEIVEEISVFKDEYKFNGAALLVRLIEMLGPELQEIRLETNTFFDNLLTKLQKSKWDILSQTPLIRDKLTERKNAGGSTEDLWSKVTNAFSHCDDAAFKTHHSQFLQNNPSPNADGSTVLKYLINAQKVTKRLIREGTWKCAVPVHHDKTKATSKKRKSDDSDIAAFAASTKKLKAELKAKENTIKQLKGTTAVPAEKNNPQKDRKRDKEKQRQAPPAQRDTTQRQSEHGRPPKGLYSQPVKEYYGPNCSYHTK